MTTADANDDNRNPEHDDVECPKRWCDQVGGWMRTTVRLVTTGILMASLVLTAGGVIVVGAASVRAAVLISLAAHQKRHRS